jgi:histidinol-phosphate aminotransferase
MELHSPPLSRRGFVQILGVGAAAAAAHPLLSPAFAQLPATATGVVRLNSNENPYGPSPAALDAMRKAFDQVWRYPDEAADGLLAELAKLHAVPGDHILLGNGSSEILKLAAAAFTGPGKPVVMADPTFEAIGRYARTAGAEVVKVPLTSDYRHDLDRMLPAGAGLVYLCNPNNPTASLTPKAQVRSFLTRVPKTTVTMVDEAYFHYAESGDYESVIPFIKDHPNLVVARTFSKIHGMAGLRCGYAVAQPATLERLRQHQAWDNVNIMALVAAQASLGDAVHLERSRRLNRETRSYVVTALISVGHPCLPTETNFLMTDLRRDVGPVIDALKKRGVEVGRRFAALPNCLRVTIGTRPQMEAFLGALRKVLAS